MAFGNLPSLRPLPEGPGAGELIAGAISRGAREFGQQQQQQRQMEQQQAQFEAQALLRATDGISKLLVQRGDQEGLDELAKVYQQNPVLREAFGGEVKLIAAEGNLLGVPIDDLGEQRARGNAEEAATSLYVQRQQEGASKEELNSIRVPYANVKGEALFAVPEQVSRPSVKASTQEVELETKRKERKEVFLERNLPKLQTAITNVDEAISIIEQDPSITKNFIGRALGIGEAGKFESLISQDVLIAIFEQSGKQVSDKERKAFQKIYSPGFFTDPDNAKFRLNMLKGMLESLAAPGIESIRQVDKIVDTINAEETGKPQFSKQEIMEELKRRGLR